jgi:hypothetical protein
MLQVGENVLVSDDVAESHFVCDLKKCQGACCVAGDMGAPLEAEEIEKIKQVYPHVKEYLSPESIEQIESLGFFERDENESCTPLLSNGMCAYARRNEQGLVQCGFELAYQDGKTDFIKPISCHLYPVRISQFSKTIALNYHRWEICAAACELGKSLQIPLYVFLKEPLIRKFGQSWYESLCYEIEALNGSQV